VIFSTTYTGNPALSTPQLITFVLNVPVSNATTYWIEVSPNSPFFFDSLKIYGSSSSTYPSGEAKFELNSSPSGVWVDDSNVHVNVADLDMSVLIEPTPSTNIDWRCNYKPLYL